MVLMVLLQGKLYFSKDPERVQHFPLGSIFSRGGGGGGGGGGQMLISIETHVTCDFPGGRTPYPPPLDPHLTDNVKSIASTNTVCDRYTNGINS